MVAATAAFLVKWGSVVFGLFALAIAALPAGSPPTLNDAISCAQEIGKTTALPPDNLVRIAEDARNQCEGRFAAAIEQAIETVASSSGRDPKFAHENIVARMRIEALSQIIARMEAGEALSIKPGDDVNIAPIVRAYIECSRLAVYRKAQKVYLSDNFPQILKGKDQSAVDDFFVLEAKATCPATRARAETAMNKYLLSGGEVKPDRRQRDVDAFMADTDVQSVRPLTAGLISGKE